MARKLLHKSKFGLWLIDTFGSNGWEVTNIEVDTDWHSEEIWTVSSVWENFGRSVLINFLVDGEDIGEWKGKNIRWMTASMTKPEYMLPRDDDIAFVWVGRHIGDVDLRINQQELLTFFRKLNEFRHSFDARASNVST